jgi:sortase B
MLVSIFFIVKNIIENKKQEEIFDEILDIVTENVNKEESENSINIEDLYKVNNDLVGWIKIDDTNINYPVMQYKNEYYLRRNFYKYYSNYGTPFISETTNVDVSDNIIIYGHNMHNKMMFGELEEYKNESYYKEHSIIEFYTLKDKKEYQIFSVFEMNLSNKNCFKYYEYSNFINENNFKEFVNNCKNNSKYKTNVDINYGDKFITLSTCSYSSKNARLVIVAKEI